MKNIVFVRHRELKGLSQLKLAAELGICSDYVNMIENNKRRPGFALAKRIADYFETTVDNLFFYPNKEQNIQYTYENVLNEVAKLILNKDCIIEKCTAIGLNQNGLASYELLIRQVKNKKEVL